jgi:hypothetical protein
MLLGHRCGHRVAIDARRAVAAPIPLAAPVISAILSRSLTHASA